jgi:hypothetical protein
VQKSYDPDRYRHCLARLREFIKFVGKSTRVQELRADHVERWLASKRGVQAPGTRRLYAAMILAALNWAAGKKVRLIASNPLKGMVDLPEGGSRGGEAVWPSQVFKTVINREIFPSFEQSWSPSRQGQPG